MALTIVFELLSIEGKNDAEIVRSPVVGEMRRGMDRREIAKRLVELRGGKSREEVANDLGITPRALESYENGSRMPRDGVKAQIADYYEIRVDLLFFTA